MTLEIWFEFASTYSYLTVSRAEAVLRKAKIDFVWRPFLLGPIFRDRGMNTSPFVLDPVGSCAPEPPVPYSTDPTSEFYAQAKATYDTVAANTPWQLETALFWRDNPDGTTGLPAGHWALIALTLIRDLGYELAEAAELMAVHGIAVADGFTSCWTEKYRTNLLRPVTYVRNTFDPNWVTPVNTPQFPEYTSGHSVGSGAAATVLTAMAGTVGFTDNTNPAHPARSYRSVWDAANEAAISRQYGGIHYPMGISAGIDQGCAWLAKSCRPSGPAAVGPGPAEHTGR